MNSKIYIILFLFMVISAFSRSTPDKRNEAGSAEFDFASAGKKTDTAIFAGGCFWGVEYFLQKAPGVVSTEVGYTGGHTQAPTYRDVCTHTTGHAEAVRVVYDPGKTDYVSLVKYFFDIHDPTQIDGQGPDIGDQYRSEIFYLNADQKALAEKVILELKGKGFQVATRLAPASKFWVAEDYHQDYYLKENGTPYCHKYVNRF